MEHLGGLIHRMPQTAFVFLIGCVGDLGAAAAQRLRLRMADLPGDPAQPAAAAMGAEVPGAGGRRAAGAVGGARRRLLRQGLRRHLPRPRRARRRPSGAREADRFSLAAMFVLAALCLLAGILPGVVHRRAGAGGAEPGRRPHAGAGAASTGSRSCRSPRAAAPTTACSSSSSCAISGMLAAFAIHRLASDGCAARRPGTAAFPIRARRRSTPPAASPSRSAASSARSCSARASTSRCRRPATRGRRGSTVELRDLVWDALYAPVAGARRLRRRPAQPSAVPDHPPLSSAWSSPRSCSLLLVLAIWP